MVKSDMHKRLIFIFGCLFFFVQAILAVVFYRERLYADSSYFVFEPINTGWFSIEHQRFLLGTCEVLPLIGYYLGLSLKALLILYSLNHVLFFLVLFLILIIKLNDLYGSMAIIAILTLNSLYLYVMPYLETWYATGLAVLLYSILSSGKRTIAALLITILLELTILFSHPENFILLFMFSMLFITKKRAPWPIWFKENAKSIPVILLFLLVLSAIYKFTSLDQYEDSHIGWALSMNKSASLIELIKTTLSQICVNLNKHFSVPILMLLLTLFTYFKTGRFGRAAILFLTFSGCIFIINFLFGEKKLTMYSSIHYLPVVAIVVIPFFYDIMSTYAGKLKYAALLLLFGIFITRNIEQINTVRNFTYVVNNTERLINVCDSVGGNKFFIVAPRFVSPYIDWTYPIQTLLLSAERGQDKCRTIASDEDTAVKPMAGKIFTDPSAYMMTRFRFMPADSLNPRYFHVSSGTYKTIDYTLCMTPFLSSQINWQQGNEWFTKQVEQLNGKPCIHFTGDEFGLTFKSQESSFENTTKEYFAKVQLSRFEPKANSSANALVVCDITDENGKHIFYTSRKLNPETSVKDSNTRANSYSFEIPPLNLNKVQLSIYIWNIKKEDFFVGDASVKLYTLPSTWD